MKRRSYPQSQNRARGRSESSSFEHQWGNSSNRGYNCDENRRSSCISSNRKPVRARCSDGSITYPEHFNNHCYDWVSQSSRGRVSYDRRPPSYPRRPQSSTRQITNRSRDYHNSLERLNEIVSRPAYNQYRRASRKSTDNITRSSNDRYAKQYGQSSRSNFDKSRRRNDKNNTSLTIPTESECKVDNDCTPTPEVPCKVFLSPLPGTNMNLFPSKRLSESNIYPQVCRDIPVKGSYSASSSSQVSGSTKAGDESEEISQPDNGSHSSTEGNTGSTITQTNDPIIDDSQGIINQHSDNCVCIVGREEEVITTSQVDATNLSVSPGKVQFGFMLFYSPELSPDNSTDDESDCSVRSDNDKTMDPKNSANQTPLPTYVIIEKSKIASSIGQEVIDESSKQTLDQATKGTKIIPVIRMRKSGDRDQFVIEDPINLEKSQPIPNDDVKAEGISPERDDEVITEDQNPYVSCQSLEEMQNEYVKDVEKSLITNCESLQEAKNKAIGDDAMTKITQQISGNFRPTTSRVNACSKQVASNSTKQSDKASRDQSLLDAYVKASVEQILASGLSTYDACMRRSSSVPNRHRVTVLETGSSRHMDMFGREIWLCPICLDVSNKYADIHCAKCNESYHLKCTGMKMKPKKTADWICDICAKKPLSARLLDPPRRAKAQTPAKLRSWLMHQISKKH